MRRLLLATLLAATVAAQAPTPTPNPPPTPVQTPVPASATVGSQAPAFRLNDHTGKLVAVGGATKDGTWTVLAFYPKAATPG